MLVKNLIGRLKRRASFQYKLRPTQTILSHDPLQGINQAIQASETWMKCLFSMKGTLYVGQTAELDARGGNLAGAPPAILLIL